MKLHAPHSLISLWDSALVQSLAAQVAMEDQFMQKEVAWQSDQANLIVQAVSLAQLGSEAVFRFQRECQKLENVNCESLSKPVAYGVRDEVALFVANAPVGQALSQIDCSQIPLIQKIDFAIDLLEALAEIHSVGLVHRNIRAQNIYLNDGHAVLHGVGIDRYLNPSDLCPQDALNLVTYVSPELSGALIHDIGPASDLYSLGAVLFQLFSGSAPFQGTSVSELLFQHLTIEPTFVELSESVPSVIHRILKCLLQKDPPLRYQRASSVIFDLKAVRESIQKGKPTEEFVICRNEIKPHVCDPAFVGRQAELEQLSNEIGLIKKARTRHTMVSCPSGIGKSRLILEFMRYASKENVTVLCGRGSNEAGREPMGPLLDVINQLGERIASDQAMVNLLKSRIEGHEAEISSVCPEFAKTLQFDHIVQNSGPEEFGQNRIENALAKLLATVASSQLPLMIWIDDCQWLDEQTRKILSLTREFDSSHLLLLYSMRSENQETVDEFLDYVKLDHRIELGPLAGDEVMLLQESMTGPIPTVAAQTVLKHAAGSPFMASAVIRGMFESGAIKPDASGWKVDLEILSTIQAADDAAQVLLQRLQQIPSDTLNLLSIAAIIGKEFDVQSVSEICKSPDFENHVEVAREKRLIWSRPNGTYSFAHDKIRESLLKLLNPEVRQECHLRIAEFFESNRRDQVFDLAFHFHRANRPVSALPYALEAADISRARFSLGVAEQQLKIALTGADDSEPDTAYDIYSAFADVTMLDGRYDEAENWLEKAALFTSTPKKKVHVMMTRGELEFKRGNKEKAVECYESALRDLGYRVPRLLMPRLFQEICKQAAHSLLPKMFVGTKGDTATEENRLAWQLFSKLAHGYWYTRDKFHTLWAHLRELNLAERYSATPELAQAYSEHAPVMSLLPWHSRGIEYANRSLEMRKASGDIWGQGQSRNFKSILLYSASDFETCIEQAGRAITVLERTGDYWEVHIARYQLAASLYRQGDLKGAAREAKETYNSALELGDFQATGNIIDVWVRANLNSIPDEVLARETSQPLRDTQGQCQILLTQGISLLGKEDYDAAANKFTEAIKISNKAGVLNTYITPNYAWLATTLRLKFNCRTVRSSAAEAKPIRRMLKAANKAVRVARSFKNELPHALRELGAALALAGKYAESKKSLLESVKVATDQGAKYELAQTQCMLSQFSQELSWTDIDSQNTEAQQQLQEIEASVGKNQNATQLSILDRFESLLEAGRKISSATSKEEISLFCQESINRLLRSQNAVLIDDFSESSPFREQVDMRLVNQSIKNGNAVIGESQTLSNSKKHRCEGSYLACPVVSNGEISGVLYAGNDAVRGLFGNNEIKIVEYIATTAGSALEKSESFQELEQMNSTLEKRVDDRTAIIKARSEELEATATTLRETQRSLETARDTAETHSNAKSEFLARMSHEIRTPIAAIMGFTDLMIQGVVPEDERMEKLETILESSRHLLRLINNLLDLSKVEADQMELEVTKFSPDLVVQDVLKSLSATATKKSLSLDLEIETKIPRMIDSDPTRLRQVLTNLIGNAIKFTDSGSITVNLYMDKDVSKRDLLIFEVHDSGIGMTEEQCSKIFDPFAQADTSITRKFGGTGLGLSISKKLAEEMGGDITVASSLGNGSCFRLAITPGDFDPNDMVAHVSKRSSRSASTLTERDRSRFLNKHILIVDDAETNREFLRLVLTTTGAKISICENGQEAVDLIAEDPSLDLVLMDMQMPILDGYSATRQLRAMMINLPVIALTANNMKDDDTKCMDAGCSDYLSKPVDSRVLIETIAEHLVLDQSCIPSSENNKTASSMGSPGDDECQALVQMFTGKLFKRIPELNVAIDNSDFISISQIGHWLKGTASMVGLDELAEAGIRLDEAGKNETLNGTVAAASDLETLLTWHQQTV